MRTHTLLAAAVLLLLAPLAQAADLAKIERKIAKEPAYQTKTPKYCLLVFGLDAKMRVWLVQDGDSLYVDRDGNGDLTGDGNSSRSSSKATATAPSRSATSRSTVSHTRGSASRR